MKRVTQVVATHFGLCLSHDRDEDRFSGLIADDDEPRSGFVSKYMIVREIRGDYGIEYEMVAGLAALMTPVTCSSF